MPKPSPSPLAALFVSLALIACTVRSSERAQEPAPPSPPAAGPSEPEHAPALPAPVSLPSAPGEAGVRAFVTEFMQARLRGDEARARDFLSPTALEQFSPGGLSLTGGAEGRSFDRWELTALNAADASSWEAKVRVYYPEGPPGPEGDISFDETLFIGPGPDASDTQRVWIVRGATES